MTAHVHLHLCSVIIFYETVINFLKLNLEIDVTFLISKIFYLFECPQLAYTQR